VSARALANVLAALPRRRSQLVLSISAGKDMSSILEALLPQADAVTVTRASPARSLAPEEVASAARAAAPGLVLRVVPDPHLAVRVARERLRADDLLCVSGSVYLAGIARQVLREWHPPKSVTPSRRAAWRARGEP
jgi:dihydrofolate synthase/folylpolyglutamate synthase